MEATPIPWFDLATKIAQKVKPRMQSPDHSQTSFRSPFPLCDRTKRTTSNILKPCRTLRTPRRPFGGVVGDRLPNSNDVRIHVPHLSFDAVPWDLLLAHDVTIRWSLKSSSWTKLQIWILFFWGWSFIDTKKWDVMGCAKGHSHSRRKWRFCFYQSRRRWYLLRSQWCIVGIHAWLSRATCFVLHCENHLKWSGNAQWGGSQYISQTDPFVLLNCMITVHLWTCSWDCVNFNAFWKPFWGLNMSLLRAKGARPEMTRKHNFAKLQVVALFRVILPLASTFRKCHFGHSTRITFHGPPSYCPIDSSYCAFHKNFSSSVIWMTKGTLKAFCSHLGSVSACRRTPISYRIPESHSNFLELYGAQDRTRLRNAARQNWILLFGMKWGSYFKCQLAPAMPLPMDLRLTPSKSLTPRNETDFSQPQSSNEELCEHEGQQVTQVHCLHSGQAGTRILELEPIPLQEMESLNGLAWSCRAKSHMNWTNNSSPGHPKSTFFGPFWSVTIFCSKPPFFAQNDTKGQNDPKRIFYAKGSPCQILGMMQWP